MSVKSIKRFLAGIVSGSSGYKTYGTGVTRKAIPKPKAKPRSKTAQQRRKARPKSSSKNSDSKSPGSRRRRAARR